MERKLINDLRRIRRGKADLTQEELAQRVGCTRQTIAAIEKQKYNPSLILAMRISEEMGVEMRKLFWLE